MDYDCSDSSSSDDSANGIAALAAVTAATAACASVLIENERKDSSSSTNNGVSEQGCSIPREIPLDKDTQRAMNLNRLIHGSEETCLDAFRMSKRSFFSLSAMLKNKRLMKDSMHVPADEQLAMFLHIAGRNERIRAVADKFGRSVGTVSRYFKLVLGAIRCLKDDLVKPPDSDTHPVISSNKDYMPFLKDCVGVITDVNIDASVPSEVTNLFRGPKGSSEQKVLFAIKFDLKFSYVVSGWEASADKMAMLRNALSRPKGLHVSEGKYYLVGPGYPNVPRFLAPYENARYGLKEFADHTPMNANELFNLRHSSLCAIAQRAAALLRKRFQILSETPFLPFDTQIDTVLACSIIHNHIVGIDPNDGGFLDEVIQEEEKQLHMGSRGANI